MIVDNNEYFQDIILKAYNNYNIKLSEKEKQEVCKYLSFDNVAQSITIKNGFYIGTVLGKVTGIDKMNLHSIICEIYNAMNKNELFKTYLPGDLIFYLYGTSFSYNGTSYSIPVTLFYPLRRLFN